MKKDLSAKQFVIDKHKAEIKDLAAKNKLLDKTVRKAHDVSLALHKDLELSLSDVECSIEKDGEINYLQTHRFIATLFCSALSVHNVIKTLQGIQGIYPKFPTYEQTYLNNFRRDLTAICKIVNACRIGRCQYIRQ